MNERIFELAEQSDKWSAEEYHRLFLANEYPDRQKLFNEKFAELIVKECVDEIKHLRKKYDMHQDVEPEENDWYIDAFLQVEVRLKKHFGVEE